MKKHASLLLFLLIFNVGYSQQKNIWHYIKNERVLADNTEDANARFTSSSTFATFLNNTPDYKKYLNGIWQINWVINPMSITKIFTNQTIILYC